MMVDIAALKESFQLIAPRASEVADAFYAELFSRHPAIQSLFEHVSMASQKDMLVAAIVFVVQNIEDAGACQSMLQNLGKRHVSYGVRPEHYAAVGTCLIFALEKIGGPHWKPELTVCWTEAFQMMSAHMQHGAKLPAA